MSTDLIKRLREAVQTYPQMSEDEPGGYCTEVDQLLDEAAAALEAEAKPAPAEPVAWRTFDGEGGYDYRTYEGNEGYAAEWAKRNPKHVGWVEPLYAAPAAPAPVPLTDEQIDLLWREATHGPNRDTTQEFTRWFARAIERAHGITKGGADARSVD